MKIQEIVKIIDGNVVAGACFLEQEVSKGFASDLMSDVLTIDSEEIVLITGLANLQAIRTAEMSDITCIVFARNKKVTPEMLDLANENNMVIVECKWSVFKTAGMLYQSGIDPLF